MNPLNLAKTNKLWEELTKAVNERGPPKTIKQWKESISEMKTNVRRRARDVRYGTTGTGGGSGVKPLSELEERLIALLSHLTVEGDALPEAGVPVSKELNIEQMPVFIMDDEHLEDNNENPLNDDMTGGDNIPTDRSNMKGVQSKTIIKRKMLNQSKGALELHDKTLRQLAQSNYRLAQAIQALAGALNRMTHKL
ncbi:uncharacterized protein LOC135143777 [Zophobas morio]|uniref:uncharacterized protein LOC135143777 n=1 Tax=Zophobas morio TaxID=2755281 RepID=UPI00308347A4